MYHAPADTGTGTNTSTSTSTGTDTDTDTDTGTSSSSSSSSSTGTDPGSGADETDGDGADVSTLTIPGTDESPSPEDVDRASFILNSTYRTAIVETLQERPATPSQIAEEHDIRPPHVSRGLSQLREYGIVRLLVSEDTHKGRLYGLTEEGAIAARLTEVLDI